MSANDTWYDPRSTGEIIAAMLTSPARDSDTFEDDSYWVNRGFLSRRPTPDTLARAVQLCASACEVEQRVGCDILAGLGAPDMPFRRESVGPVLEVLNGAIDPETVGCAISTLGHLGVPSVTSEVLRYCDHPNDSIRLVTAMALPGLRGAPEVVPALIRLSRDRDEDVRDWATFGLMNWIEDDTPEVRQAFLDRLDDPNAAVRGQALLGLARRRVPGTLEAIDREFMREAVYEDAVEAATKLGDPRAAPLLERLRERFPNWDAIPDALSQLRKV
jgi:HEAT repeats